MRNENKKLSKSSDMSFNEYIWNKRVNYYNMTYFEYRIGGTMYWNKIKIFLNINIKILKLTKIVTSLCPNVAISSCWRQESYNDIN